MQQTAHVIKNKLLNAFIDNLMRLILMSRATAKS